MTRACIEQDAAQARREAMEAKRLEKKLTQDGAFVDFSKSRLGDLSVNRLFC